MRQQSETQGDADDGGHAEGPHRTLHSHADPAPRAMKASLLPFVLGLLVEVPLWWLFLRGLLRTRGALLTGLVVSVIAHPVLWLAWEYTDLDGAAYWGLLGVAQAVVIVIEISLATALGPRLAGPPPEQAPTTRRGRKVRVPLTDAVLTALSSNCLSTAIALAILSVQAHG